VEPGRIGILIKYHEDWKLLGRKHAVDLDPVQAARALALCVFDRFEWGEFGLSGGQVYFVDLERLLPPIQPDALLAASEIDPMECQATMQRRGVPDQIRRRFCVCI
jgi:hypothetical protein